MEYNLITILGPTAVGKTKLGAKLALKFNGEIISADSRQVYRKMNIGTGKDLKDYIIGNTKIPFHLIDIADPEDEFNLFEFTRNFDKAFNDIRDRNKFPFMVGGTGLYLISILKNYSLSAADPDKKRISQLSKMSDDNLRKLLITLKPDQHNITDLKERDRIIKAIIVCESKTELRRQSIRSFTIGIKLERDEIKKRITSRLKQRLDNGMIDEVKSLMQDGLSLDKLNFFGLEYKFIGNYLAGQLNYNDMFQKLNSAIHQFAKKQMTWFRKMEREGIVIHWINGRDYSSAEKMINLVLND